MVPKGKRYPKGAKRYPKGAKRFTVSKGYFKVQGIQKVSKAKVQGIQRVPKDPRYPKGTFCTLYCVYLSVCSTV